MIKFLALTLGYKGNRGPVPLEYDGKFLYTIAKKSENAITTFENFVKQNDIPFMGIGAIPLTKEPTEDKYSRVYSR